MSVSSDIRMLTHLDPEFPSKAKIVLHGNIWLTGNVQILDTPAIGICGSRDASPQALQWAYRFGTEAARFGLTVVSGYARGVDRQAHKGALEAGGRTIAVLPEGIRHFRVINDLKPVIDMKTNFLAISMFEPGSTWQVSRAMSRNRLIVALSLGLFVIEAREKGGTIEAAREAVRQKKRLWAISYKKQIPGREGNQLLIGEAAIPLSTLADLRRALGQAMEEPVPEVRQLVLSLVSEESA